MNIQEFRKQYPQYSDMGDQALADALYQKSYSDMDRKEFNSKFFGAVTIAPAASISYEDPMAAQVGMIQQSGGINELGQFPKGIVEQLPIAGMVVGGALGAPAGPIGAVGGTGMGGAIGAGARGAIQTGMGWRTPPTLPGAIQEMGKEGALGAMAEMGGPLLTGPWAKYTEKVMAENALAKQGQQMVEQGIPISPDLISPSRTSRAVNWALDNLWPANSIMASKRREVYDAALQMRDSFAQQYGVGKTTKELTNKAWDDWATMAGPDTVIPMTKTVEAIRANIDKPFASGAFWDKYAKTFAEEGNVTVQGIRDLLATTKPAKAAGADKTARRAILDGLKADLAAYDAEAGTKLAEGLTGAQTASRELARIQPIERIINESITKSEGLDAGLFSPAQFVQKWEAIKAKVSGRLSAADIKLVDVFAEKMRTMMPDIQRLGAYKKIGAQISPGRLLGGSPTGSAYGVISGMAAEPLLILPIAAEVPLAYSLMNPTGLMRKWLTTGMKLPTMPTKAGLFKLGEELSND